MLSSEPIFPLKIGVNRRPYSIDRARAEHDYARNFTYGWTAREIGSWAELESIITSRVWSPIVFSGEYRSGGAFVSARLFVLDFDRYDQTIAQTARVWCDTAHLIGPTRSHMISKGGLPPHERFRLVAPFSRTIENHDDYHHSMEVYTDHYEADEKCKDRARLFFPCVSIASRNLEADFLQEPLKAPPPRLPRTDPAVRAQFGIIHRRTIGALQRVWARGLECNDLLFRCAKDLCAAGLSDQEIFDRIRRSPTYRDRVIDKNLEDEMWSCISNGIKSVKSGKAYGRVQKKEDEEKEKGQGEASAAKKGT